MQKVPLVIGVVGDSASGKSTLIGGLAEIFGAARCAVICGDDYLKFDRRERAESGITALNPDCYHLDILEQHLSLLRRGEPILKPVYDHSDGTFARPEYLVPRDLIIFKGLLGFQTEGLCSCFDHKVFLNPPENLRRAWKFKRDLTRRGYDEYQVLEELARREPDALEFVRPQRQFADTTVRFYPPDGQFIDHVRGQFSVRIGLSRNAPRPDTAELIRLASEEAPSAVWTEREPETRGMSEYLVLSGSISPHRAEELEAALWLGAPDLPRISREKLGRFVSGHEPGHSDVLALVQLFLASQIACLKRKETSGAIGA